MQDHHVIRVPAGAGDHHWIAVSRREQLHRDGSVIDGRLELDAHYLYGPLSIGVPGRPIAALGGMIRSIGEGDGHCRMTGGTMEVHSRLRGLGIGSYLQNQVVAWLKSFGRTVTVDRILLAEIHAPTQRDATRRNRFYEQFGVVFSYGETPPNGIVGATGHSVPTLTTDDLKTLRPGEHARMDEIVAKSQVEALQVLGQQLTKAQRQADTLRQERDHTRQWNRTLSRSSDRWRNALITVIAVMVAGFLIWRSVR